MTQNIVSIVQTLCTPCFRKDLAYPVKIKCLHYGGLQACASTHSFSLPLAFQSRIVARDAATFLFLHETALLASYLIHLHSLTREFASCVPKQLKIQQDKKSTQLRQNNTFAASHAEPMVLAPTGEASKFLPKLGHCPPPCGRAQTSEDAARHEKLGR
jgi:hypothetical protein